MLRPDEPSSSTASASPRALRAAPVGLAVAVAVGLFGFALSTSAPAEAQAPPPTPPAAPAPPAAKPIDPTQFIDTSSPFDHDIHLNPQKVGKAMGCQSCHEMVNADGTCPKQEVRFPKHEACAGCHNANFYTPPLTICTNCHQTAKFVAQNPLRELTRQITPRKAEFSHRSHVNTSKGASCTSCHSFIKGGLQVSHPSHPNCCECHTKPNVNPQMASCGACHTAGKNAGRPPSKIHDFTHKSHNTDPRTGASMQCGQCHVNTNAATTLRQIQIPPMATCVQCHDGSDPAAANPQNPSIKGSGAFHFSSCLKCHIAGSIDNVPLPPSHPTEAAPPGAIK